MTKSKGTWREDSKDLKCQDATQMMAENTAVALNRTGFLEGMKMS